MSARIDTIYDRDVDRSDCGLVSAPLRVRSELRHAAPRLNWRLKNKWHEPAACTSDNVQLETFRATTVVCRPTHPGAEK